MEILYELKQVAFEIVINDAQLKTQVAAVKKALASIKGAGVDIKLNVTKAEIAAMRKKIKDTLVSTPITVAIKGTDKLGKNGEDFNKGISRAVVNMQKFLDLMQKASAESQNIRNNLGSNGGGGGNRINGGSRTGFTDSAGARLSAFSGFIRGGQSFTSQIGAYASGIGRLGLTAALPVAGAALGVRSFVSAVTDIQEFGAANANLAAVLGTTRDGIASLTEQAKQLGSEMAFTATEITGAQIELAKLGFTADEIKSSTEGVARFAIVAGANIPEAAEAAGAALQSFGLDAAEMDRVVSVLGVSTAKSALDFEKLKVGIGTTFATAKTFGLEIEDVAALLGELSNKGLSASVAATATRNILLGLADTNGKLRRTLNSIGVKDVKGLDGITEALRQLNAAGIDLTTTFEITGKREVNAFNAFLRGGDSVKELRDSLVDVNDEFKIMEKERLNSLQGSITLFRSALERSNLTLGVMEGLLMGIVDAGSGVLNFFSDMVSSSAADAIGSERDNFAALVNTIIDANDNYALRAQLIARLKISYPDLVKGIDIEKLSVSELNKFLRDNLVLYDKRINIQVGETDFERAIRRENEALEEQSKILRRNQDANKSIYEFNPDAGRFEQDAKTARDDQFKAISSTLSGSNTITIDQEQRLRDIVKESPSVRGGKPSRDAGIALGLLGSSERLRASVRPNIPNFTEADFAIPSDGSLNRFEKYNKELEKQLELFPKNSVQADELRKAIKSLDEVEEKRRRLLNVPNKDGRGDDKLEKKGPLQGSIDFLEAEYQRLLKEIDAVADENLRPKLQKQSESFKKQIQEARDKLKADLEPTEGEKINLFNTLVDNQRDIDSEANKKRFKDDRIRDAVELEQIKKSELRKIFFRGQYQKKAFDAGLDKSGEYLKAQQEFANKLVELEDATGKRVLAVGEVSREMEVKDRLAILREIYEDEEDYAKAKESLFLELQAAKIKAAVAAGDALTLIEEEQLNGILDKINEINSQLSKSNFVKALDSEQGNIFNNAFNSANADGKLSKGEISQLEDLEKKLGREREKAIANEAILRAKTESEKIAAQYEYNKLVIRHQKEEYEDRKAKIEEIASKVRAGAEIASDIADKIFDYERTQLEAKSESELETIDTLYAARLKAAEGNASETARLEQEYQLKKAAQEKKAAEQRRQIALKEASINLALSILKAAPDLLLMGVAAITGAIQIATIRSQKFAKGGYTGNGKGRPDETGHVPVGIVHDGEYVIPKWQVKKNLSLVRSLESDRQRGYASGGFATQGLSMESFVVMADIIAQRVASEVSAATYQGTMMGSEKGTSGGLTKAVRETNSRNSAKIINTF